MIFRTQRIILRPAAIVLLFAALTSTAAMAGDYGNSKHYERIVGTWLITVDFGAPGPVPFREFITFHRGGTLTETNTTLNMNSETDPNAPIAVNGSDGQGTWRRAGRNKVRFTFHKMVFCGAIPQPTPTSVCQNNQLYGFLRVDGVLKIRGDEAVQDGNRSRTVLLAPDLSTLLADFGGADATAKRVR